MDAGLYLHIPFCKSKCAYCDFARVKYTSVLFDKWLSNMDDYKKFN